MKRITRSISPVIATVIIVAVAIAISVAVAGWLFGLWSGLAGGTPQISVSNVKVTSDGKIDIYYVNSGSGSDKILKVEISNGQNTVEATLNNQNAPQGFETDNIIQANEKGWIEYTFDTNQLTVNPGDSVTVKIYFERSGTITIPTTVSS